MREAADSNAERTSIEHWIDPTTSLTILRCAYFIQFIGRLEKQAFRVPTSSRPILR